MRRCHRNKLRSALIACSAFSLLQGCGDCDLPPEYCQLAVPEERIESPEARERGRELYLDNCALCHGERADGEGRRRNLSSRPQDFTDPAWLERTTPRENFHDVREGVRGTAMASWKVLGDDQIWDLVAYLRSVASG